MYTAHDVAKYILKHHGPMTAMKLEKLVYYSQAWSLVWEEKALFKDRIEAWAAGPVIPALYKEHRGKFEVASWPMGDDSVFSSKDLATIESVCDFYANRTAQQLSDLTHREAPWVNARKGLADGERGNALITTGSLAEYYGSLRAQ